MPSIAKRDDLYVDAGADVVISSLYDLDFAAFLPAGSSLAARCDMRSDWIAHETLLDPVLPLPEIVRVGGGGREGVRARVEGFGNSDGEPGRDAAETAGAGYTGPHTTALAL